MIDSQQSDVFRLRLVLQPAPFANVRIGSRTGRQGEGVDEGLDLRRSAQRPVAKCLRGDEADEGLIAMLPQAFVGGEEESLVPKYRTACAAAKLVKLEGRQRCRIERATRVERAVAHVLECRTVERVGARFGNHF